MRLWKLKLSMVGTLALVIGFTTLIVAGVMSLIGSFNVYAVIGVVVFINVLQWLFAPHIIDAIYRVRELSPSELPWLHQYVEDLSLRSGIDPPKLMIAEIPIPNAFAYGSPIAGRRVAVTRGLIEALPRDEVKAVVGHEIGHLKHRDMEVMMLASMLPALVMILGRWLMFAGIFSGGRRDREGGGPILFLVGSLLLFLSFILNLLVLGLSRLREYYADSHAAMVVEEGAGRLQRALVRLTLETRRLASRGVDMSNFSQFRALFITDPVRAVDEGEAVLSGFMGADRVAAEIERLKRKELTLTERILELFSTHPNVVKRIRALEELKRLSV